MQTIELKDIPSPDQSDGTIALEIKSDIEQKVFSRLDELDWHWAGISNEKASVGNAEMGLNPGYPVWWLFLGCYKQKIIDRLFWGSCLDTGRIGLIPIPDQSEITVVTYDLKVANTSLSATHCLRCGGQLKDPGMGPTYKHCPKCEP